MQNSNRLRRLLRELESDPLRTWAVVAKCGGGLAVIVLVVLIGAGSADNRDTIARAKEAASPAVQPAEAHRLQEFDERRQRFNGGNAPRNVAGKLAPPANRMAFMPH